MQSEVSTSDPIPLAELERIYDSMTYMQRWYILNKEYVKAKNRLYREKYKAIKYQREKEQRLIKKMAVDELLAENLFSGIQSDERSE
jgi:hypothetical protein